MRKGAAVKVAPLTYANCTSSSSGAFLRKDIRIPMPIKGGSSRNVLAIYQARCGGSGLDSPDRSGFPFFGSFPAGLSRKRNELRPFF